MNQAFVKGTSFMSQCPDMDTQDMICHLVADNLNSHQYLAPNWHFVVNGKAR